MKRIGILMVGLVITFNGCCSNQKEGGNLGVIRDILQLAQYDKVEGNLRVHLSGEMEAGIKESVYFGSPGSVVQADLAFKIKDVQPPTTQPATTQPQSAEVQPATPRP